MNLTYPYQFSALGRTAAVDDERHVRDLIEQVLFTAPGERVMRPTFGSAVSQLVFAGNSPELASASQMLVQSSLQHWLGDLITVMGVRVEAVDAQWVITLQYRLRRSDQVRIEQFSHTLGASS